MHGKWSDELNQINQINIRINTFELDVAQIKSTPPRNFVNRLTQKLNTIKVKIKNTQQERSFFDAPRRHIVEKNINLSQARLNNLLTHIFEAESSAKNILNECKKATENTIQRYSFNPDHSHIVDPSNRLSDTFSTSSVFSNINTAGGMVWASVRAQKAGVAKISGYTQTDGSSQLLHNSLVNLLETNDKEFVDAVDSDKLTIEGEIGHLILQRLKDIQHGGGSFSQEKPAKEIVNMCAKAITRAIGNTNDGIFKCDFDAFYVELTKLALHARLHPMSKKIWLGTARVVIAVISENVGNGTYLNCDEKKWTWHLNRMWLHAAIHLGYSIELIEQHFPKVEPALICGDNGASFVLFLLSQVRPTNKVSSQYDGYDAPTATAQEILVLLDIGCNAKKNHTNNRIIFSKGGPRETPLPRSSWLNCAQVSVFNSWDSGSPPASPLKRSPSQFFLSETSSSELRRNNSKLFLPIENVISSDDTIMPSSLSL